MCPRSSSRLLSATSAPTPWSRQSAQRRGPGASATARCSCSISKARCGCGPAKWAQTRCDLADFARFRRAGGARAVLAALSHAVPSRGGTMAVHARSDESRKRSSFVRYLKSSAGKAYMRRLGDLVSRESGSTGCHETCCTIRPKGEAQPSLLIVRTLSVRFPRLRA